MVAGIGSAMFKQLLAVVIGLGALIGVMVPDRPAPDAAKATKIAVATTTTGMRGKPVDTVLTRRADGHFYVDALVNGQSVRFVVDTGASVVALTTEDARRIGIDFSPARFEVVGRGASGAVLGERVTLQSVAIDQKEAFDVSGVVLDQGLDVSLLGQSYLSRVGSVAIARDEMTLR